MGYIQTENLKAVHSIIAFDLKEVILTFIDDVNRANKTELPKKADLNRVATDIVKDVKKQFLTRPKIITHTFRQEYQVCVLCYIYGYNEKADSLHPAVTDLYYDDGHIRTAFFASVWEYQKVFHKVDRLCKQDGIKASNKKTIMVFTVPKR